MFFKYLIFSFPILLSACQVQKNDSNQQNLSSQENLRHWNKSNFGTEGEILFNEHEILIGYGYPLSGINWKGPELPKDNYSIEFEAFKVEGNDFFVGLTFPVGQDFCSLILGGWGGTTCGLSSFDYQDASSNETTFYQDFEVHRWYKIKMSVQQDQLMTWIDGKKVIDTQVNNRKVHIRPEVEESKPLGLSTFETVSRIRNIKFTQLK